MPFCRQYNSTSGVTNVSDIFIKEYMPNAPQRSVEVYLYGLSLCSSDDSINQVEVMERALDLTQEDLASAYDYWEQLGIVTILSRSPLTVAYLPVDSNSNLLRKINPGKYLKFNKAIQSALNNRMMSVNEYNEYYLFLEQTTMEWEALVEVAKYCVTLKGGDINNHYIIKVARSFADKGLRTVEKVKEHVNSLGLNYNDIKLVLKALNSTRQPELADREKLQMWTNQYGFTLDVVLAVAKTVKRGGMERLDSDLGKYYSLKLFDTEEINSYEKHKQSLYDYAKRLTKAIGVYYNDLDPFISNYLMNWLNNGFEIQTLEIIATYCFKTGVRSLEGLNDMVNRFFNLGLVNHDAIDEYIRETLQTNNRIKSILTNLGLKRNVIKSDRRLYKQWTEEWQLPDDLIDYAVSICSPSDNPIPYLNKILSTMHLNGIKSVSQAEQNEIRHENKVASTKMGYTQRDYTEAELRAVFDNLDEVEI